MHRRYPAAVLLIASLLLAGGSAARAAARVTISPLRGTPTAMPRTQISFLGAGAGTLSSISVIGSSSGRHRGRLRAYRSATGVAGNSFSAIAAGVAIVKVSDSLRVLRLDARHLACTVTRSPRVKALLGTKLAPVAEL